MVPWQQHHHPARPDIAVAYTRLTLWQYRHGYDLQAAAIRQTRPVRLTCRPTRRVGPQTQPMFVGKCPITLVRKIKIQLDHILERGACLVQNDLQITKHKCRLLALIGRIVIAFQPLAEDVTAVGVGAEVLAPRAALNIVGPVYVCVCDVVVVACSVW